eukprot:TRINITY_DN1944_c1_g2_i1.p2 TRINITY_DN1944_c1_g2~~TRINITY_DN1944_c1_g2_i1.p2  ORF type:complete len:119 (-),score=17.43 TRINITY_DN1944_c1_g2_i1:404-760(-)
MGQLCCRRSQSPVPAWGQDQAAAASRADTSLRRRGGPDLFPGRADYEAATEQDRAIAEECGRKCVLAYSRVAMESLRASHTVGELREYVEGLQARERMLNGYDGADDREREGLVGRMG